jgi:glycerophosphoryl diester phosphodiesterase
MASKNVRFIFSVFLLLACNKPEVNINNLNNNQISVFGHGGMGVGHTYPMNSFESIANCLNLGANGSEIDIQLTKDSVLVLFHSYDLSQETNLYGLINEYNWEEIKDGFYQNSPYLNYKIITLDQLFSGLPDLYQFTFTFDCKLYHKGSDDAVFHDQYISALITFIEKYQLHENVFIESQSIGFLQKLKDANPYLKLFIYPSSFDEGLRIAKSMNLKGITISTRAVTKDQIALAHKEGIMVAVWNTHSAKDNLEAIEKNPDFIQTDNLRHLIKVLKKD